MIKALASSAMRLLLSQVAKRYVAGPTLDDGLRLARRYRAEGLGVTLGYWDQQGEPPAQVLREYLAAGAALAALEGENYVSVKATALDYGDEPLDQLAEAAMARGLRLHFDAMGPESADPTRLAIERLRRKHGSACLLGTTLPGRWKRSVRDAAWASELGLAVRIVKGQFPDADQRDPFEGYLDVALALAGRASRVAVASHHPLLAEKALRCLLEAGTPATLEQLHGLPMRRQRQIAQQLGIETTAYVAYGQAYLPYVVSSVLRNPKALLPLARQLLPF